MKKLAFSALSDIRYFDHNHFECVYHGTDYFGFVVEASHCDSILELSAQLSDCDKICKPVAFVVHNEYCYFLLEGILERANDHLKRTGLLRFDSACESFFEICDIFEFLNAKGIYGHDVDISSFLWPIPIPHVRLFDLSNLLFKSVVLTDIKERVSLRNRSLGKILSFLLTSNESLSIAYLRAARPSCPQSIIDLLDDLSTSNHLLSIDAIRARIELNAPIDMHPLFRSKRESSLAASLLYDIQHDKSNHALVRIEHSSSEIVYSIASDISSFLLSPVIIDAGDPCSTSTFNLSDIGNASSVIVLNPEYVASDALSLLFNLKTRIILLHHSSTNTKNKEYSFLSHIFSKLYRTFNIDLSSSGVRELFRSRSLFTSNAHSAITSTLYESAISLYNFNTFIDTYLSSPCDTAISSCNCTSSFKPDTYITHVFNSLIVGKDSLTENTLAISFRYRIPLCLNYLNIIGIDHEIISSFISSRLAIIITSGKHQLLYPCNNICFENLPFHLDTFLSYLDYIGFYDSNDDLLSSYFSAATHVPISHINLGSVIKACHIYHLHGRFDVIAPFIENIAFESRNKDLILCLMGHIKDIPLLSHIWEDIVLTDIHDVSSRVFCMENLIEYYKHRDDHERAVDIGLRALSMMGVYIDKNLSTSSINLKYTKILLSIRFLGVDAYFGKKDTIDTSSESAIIIRISAKTVASAFIVAPNVLASISIKTIKYCRGSFVSPYMPQMIMVIAMIAGNYAYSISMAQRIYFYARTLVNTFNLNESLHAINFFYITMILPYLDSEAIDDQILSAYRDAQNEDEEYASYLSGASLAYGIYNGKHIKVIAQRFNTVFPSILRFNHATPITIHKLINSYLGACRTTLTFDFTENIRESDGTSNFTHLCLQLMLSIHRDDDTALLYFDKLKRFQFGVKGLLVLISAQHIVTYDLFKNRRYSEIIKIALKFFIFKSRNHNGFYSKYKHVSAYILGMLGFHSLMVSRMKKAAAFAEEKEQLLDAAIIHDHISRLSEDASVSRNHALYASAIYDQIGYYGCSRRISKTLLFSPNSESTSHRLHEFNSWLLRLSPGQSLSIALEKRLTDLLDADLVIWFSSHDVVPTEYESFVDDCKINKEFVHLDNNGKSHFCNGIYVEGDYQGSLYIQYRSNLHSVEYLLLFVDALSMTFARNLYHLKALSAITRESLLVSHFPVLQHEIGQPLAAIQELSQLFIEKGHINLSDITLIVDACNEIYRILDAITEVEAAESGATTINKNSFSLINEVSSISKRLSIYCDNKGIELIEDISISEDIWIETDQGMLRSILKNIADNAAKYTDKGYIKYSAHAYDISAGQVELVFKVDDTGPGIERSDIERIFDLRYRADTSTTRRASGFGIGLFQCRRYTNLLGGNLNVASEIGVGSSFTFKCRFDKTFSKKHEQVHPTNVNLRALVCDDDDQYSIITTTKRLSSFGIHAIYTTSPKEAIALAKQGILVGDRYENFDLIFIDIEMPIIDGFQVAQSIDENGSSSVLVAITSRKTLRGDKRAGIFHEFVRKPLRSESLSHILEQYFSITVTDNAVSSKDNGSETRLLDIEYARSDIGFSEIEIKSILLSIIEDLKQSYGKIKEYVSSDNSSEFAMYIHTLQNPLDMFNSTANDYLDSISKSSNPLQYANDKLFNLISGLIAEAESAINSLSIPPTPDSKVIFDTFTEYLSKSDHRMCSYLNEYEEHILSECANRSKNALKKAVSQMNGQEAYEVFCGKT